MTQQLPLKISLSEKTFSQIFWYNIYVDKLKYKQKGESDGTKISGKDS